MVLELDFKAKVDDSDINGINEFLGVSKDVDIDTGKPTFYIDYELQPEAREWGIKGISVIVKKITASIEWETDCEFLNDEEKQTLIKAGGIEMRNDTISGTFELDTTQKVNGKEWTIDNETAFADDGAFSLDNISIEFPSLSIIIS